MNWITGNVNPQAGWRFITCTVLYYVRISHENSNDPSQGHRLYCSNLCERSLNVVLIVEAKDGLKNTENTLFNEERNWLENQWGKYKKNVSRKLKDLKTDINKNANRHEKFKRRLNG